MERSSRVLHHGNPKIWFFFQKSSKFKFWLFPKSWNHLSFVNISPTLVIDTSMERSSRVLQHGNQKNWFFFSKKFEIEFDLYFDLCWRAEIIQVGLNMHLYVDIGDASSYLWGSTSSWNLSFSSRKELSDSLAFVLVSIHTSLRVPTHQEQLSRQAGSLAVSPTH